MRGASSSACMGLEMALPSSLLAVASPGFESYVAKSVLKTIVAFFALIPLWAYRFALVYLNKPQ